MELTRTIELYCENHSLAQHATPDNLLYAARDYALDNLNSQDRIIFMGAVAQKTFRSNPDHYGWSNAFANWPRIFPSGTVPTYWLDDLYVTDLLCGK